MSYAWANTKRRIYIVPELEKPNPKTEIADLIYYELSKHALKLVSKNPVSFNHLCRDTDLIYWADFYVNNAKLNLVIGESEEQIGEYLLASTIDQLLKNSIIKFDDAGFLIPVREKELKESFENGWRFSEENQEGVQG